MKAFENVDPPTSQQRAITPKFLRAMFDMSGAGCEAAKDSVLAISADIAIVAFFFAMRSCEITSTPTPGRTKIIRLRGIVFRDANNNVLDHSSDLSEQAVERVTLTFENQKNGQKMAKRTHQRTEDPVLCPVRRLVSLVTRIYRTVPGANENSKVNVVHLTSRVSHVTNELLKKHIRTTCTLLGGVKTFGFDAADIGTKSLRSGAAMSLFLMNHSVDKIMMLGRWSSAAFLVYIRPQVLEWTNNMSSDMIHNNSFFDATESLRTKAKAPKLLSIRYRGDHTIFPIHLRIEPQ